MTIMTGLATSGATSFSTGGDPAAPGNLCPTHSVESTLNSAVAETTALEQTICPDASPSAAPNGDANSVAANPDSWRIEVAARLQRYRTRRKPRTPRYPSLLLPFDAPEDGSHPATPTPSAETASAATGAPSVTHQTAVQRSVTPPSSAGFHMRNRLRSHSPRSSSFRVPPQFRFFVGTN